MPSPFPGMDPYLESPVLGTDFHVGFAAEICKQLSPRLRPAYVVRMKPQDVEEQLDMNEMNALFSGYSLNRLPSRVPFRQTAIEIRDVRSGLLVTAIELLSPVNKRPGSEGRAAYLRKRDTLLASTVHLLEIDLMRRGDRLPLGPAPAPTDYYIVLSRSDDRPDADIWPVSVRAPLPAVPVPLLAPDPDVALDLNAALQTVYDNAAYDLDVDYTVPPFPPLEGEDAAWADQLLRQQSLRD